MKKVYLMKCANYYKIGISKNPESRRRAIQTHNPFKVEYVASSILQNNAESLEKEIHNSFASVRAIGEWFELKERHLTTLEIDYEFDFIIPIADLIINSSVPKPNMIETKNLRVKKIEFEEIAQYIESFYDGWLLSDIGKSSLKRLFNKFDATTIMEAAKICIDRNDCISKAIDSMPKMCKKVKLKLSNPKEYFFQYVKGIYYNRYRMGLHESWHENIMCIYDDFSGSIDELCIKFSKVAYKFNEDEFLNYIEDCVYEKP